MAYSTWTWKSCLLGFVCALTCAASGCSLLFPETTSQTAVKSPLKPLVAPRQAITLEVYFIDRRIGDPLIGETLWDSLHSVSSIDPETRRRLRDDGFRVAMSAARPPRALQVLMALSDENDPTRRAVVQHYMIPSEQETWIVCRQVENGTSVTRRPLEGGARTFEVNQGQAIFKVKASRVEDGWANLVIIPEIQHGQSSLKPTATSTEWTLRDRRQAITLFEDRLSAELNVGEILVVGMTDDGAGKLASHFFHSDKSNGLQRLMMIRIADMRSVEPHRIDSDSAR